jgi:catechol 2,3-dioxygenase-like lactoylglutathione lyase family enzyme
VPGADLHGRVFPILPSRDVDETIAFYERLGFLVASRFGGKRVYLVVRRDGVVLHFFHFPALDPPSNINGCYVEIADVDALYDEWHALGLKRLAPPQDREWGMREFTLVDPSGNLVRVGSPTGAGPPRL